MICPLQSPIKEGEKIIGIMIPAESQGLLPMGQKRKRNSLFLHISVSLQV